MVAYLGPSIRRVLWAPSQGRNSYLPTNSEDTVGRQLESLTLENFKAFGRRTTIPLAPITILVGENSAGKSSVIQSLLFLKQTLAHAETGRETLLPKGTLVDLGSIRELLFRHDCERTCEIAAVLSPETERNPFSYSSFEDEATGLGVSFGCSTSGAENTLEMRDPRLYWLDEGDESPLAVLKPTPDSFWESHAAWGKRTGLSRSVQPKPSVQTRQVKKIAIDHAVMTQYEQQFAEFRRDILEALSAWPNTSKFANWECYEAAGDWPGAIQFIEHLLAKHGRDFLDEFTTWLDAYTLENYFARVKNAPKSGF